MHPTWRDSDLRPLFATTSVAHPAYHTMLSAVAPGRRATISFRQQRTPPSSRYVLPTRHMPTVNALSVKPPFDAPSAAGGQSAMTPCTGVFLSLLCAAHYILVLQPSMHPCCAVLKLCMHISHTVCCSRRFDRMHFVLPSDFTTSGFAALSKVSPLYTIERHILNALTSSRCAISRSCRLPHTSTTKSSVGTCFQSRTFEVGNVVFSSYLHKLRDTGPYETGRVR